MKRNSAAARHSWARQHAWLLLNLYPFPVGANYLRALYCCTICTVTLVGGLMVWANERLCNAAALYELMAARLIRPLSHHESNHTRYFKEGRNWPAKRSRHDATAYSRDCTCLHRELESLSRCRQSSSIAALSPNLLNERGRIPIIHLDSDCSGARE